MKAVIKYPGSKWSMLKQIIALMPEHHSYVEPYFGSGAVLFNKERSNIETVNDISGSVVNLFECIKEDPERLARMIYLTPYSRDVYDKAFTAAPKDKYEAALNFYIRCNMGHGFRLSGVKVGWKIDVTGREKSYCTMDWCGLPDIIIQAAERLRGVQIENRPAVNVIKRFNHANVLIYCDPPYVMSAMQDHRQYEHQMSDDDHEELLDILLLTSEPVFTSTSREISCMMKSHLKSPQSMGILSLVVV